MSTDAITKPISPDEPCGQDLDLEEDGAYLQFTSLTEALLPDSYMVEDEEGKRVPFYATQRFGNLDLGASVAAGEKLLNRTHDLRLLATVAKLHLLNRSPAKFVSTVRGMALLLDSFPTDVHPQGVEERSAALERLTEPLLLSALNHAVLFKSRRFGMVTWLSYQAATKTMDEAGGTESVDRILRDEIKADATPVVEAQALIGDLRAALGAISAAWVDHGAANPPRLGKISEPVGAMAAFLERIHPTSENVSVDATPDPSADLSSEPIPPVRNGTLPLLPNAETAAAALAEAERFFATVEPSSPCLLLLRQAQALVGRSFFEAVQVLLPRSVDKVAFSFGTGPLASLPLSQVVETAVGGMAADSDERRSASRPFSTVTSRAEALMLLDQVNAFYRFVEPSSPIPLLVDRARTLAGKDFTALLKAMLPDASASD